MFGSRLVWATGKTDSAGHVFRQWVLSGEPTSSGVDHVFAAQVLEELLDAAGIVAGVRSDADDHAAAAQGLLVGFGVLFRDAEADKSADHAAGDAARSGACQSRGNRSGDDNAQARQRQRGADG